MFHYLGLLCDDCFELCLVKGIKIIMFSLSLVLLQRVSAVIQNRFPHGVNVNAGREDVDALEAPTIDIKDDVLKQHALARI